MFKKEDHSKKNKKDKELNDDVETIIGPSVKIEGDFQGQGNIMVAGSVHGTLKTSQKIRIDEGAKIVADIEAEDAIVAGEIEGNLKVHNNLEILTTAKITGDILTGNLTIEQGAQINGRCSMQKGEASTAEDIETEADEQSDEGNKKTEEVGSEESLDMQQASLEEAGDKDKEKAKEEWLSDN